MASLQQQDFALLARNDQLALADMMESFRQELGELDDPIAVGLTEMPGEADAARKKLAPMLEKVTFHQSAAVYRAAQGDIEAMAVQQQLALETLEQCEELLDEFRRSVAAALDEIEGPTPNVADLVDPTLDDLLRALEREPNAATRLGLGNRRQNLRVLSDWTLYQQRNRKNRGKGDPSEKARARARELMEAAEEPQEESIDGTMTEMEVAIERLLERANEAGDPREADRLRSLAKELQDAVGPGESKAQQRERWRRMAKADKLRNAMRAVANGEQLPNNQWNRLLSSLERGLLQVRGRTAPEEFQRAIEQYRERVGRLRNRAAPVAGDSPSNEEESE